MEHMASSHVRPGRWPMTATKGPEKRRRIVRWLQVARKVLSAIDKALVSNAQNETILS